MLRKNGIRIRRWNCGFRIPDILWETDGFRIPESDSDCHPWKLYSINVGRGRIQFEKYTPMTEICVINVFLQKQEASWGCNGYHDPRDCCQTRRETQKNSGIITVSILDHFKYAWNSLGFVNLAAWHITPNALYFVKCPAGLGICLRSVKVLHRGWK